MGATAAAERRRRHRLARSSQQGAESSSPADAALCTRMDPRQSNAGEGSQGQFPGAMMNPSGYAHHSEADLEEVAPSTAKTTTKKSVTRTKLSNFNPDEDKNLVKSWLESCDPITSTGQKGDRMWARIIERYNSRRASDPVRSLRSLQSRWDRIKSEVTLFASYYADSIRENPSGMSDADKTTHAVGNFVAVQHRKFGFLHCWELMKDAPKWQDPNARDIATAARGEGFGEESTAGTDTVDPDPAEGQSSPVDSAKAAKKKENSDAGSQEQFPGAMMDPSGYAPEGFPQAEITEVYVHHSEADLEEVAAPTAKTRTKKSVTRTKLSNFNPDEDKNLVKSWLEISCDPIACIGQRMWDRIMERYNSRRACDPVRSLRSLQSRWDKIRAEVTLFASYYADSIQENPSEMLDADKTTHAAGKFAAVQHRKFGFLHCWELMKDAPKWQNPNAKDIATAARGEGFGEQSTAGTDTVDPAEGQSSPVRSRAQVRRPMGRDSANAELMKDAPKWQDPNARDSATAAQGEGFGEQSTAGTDTVDPAKGQSSPVRSRAQVRSPMGRDSAKAAKKKANSDAGSASSAEYAARMQDLSFQRISLMQEEPVRRNEHFQQLASIDEKRFEEMRRNNEALIQIEQEKIRLMREQHEDERRREERKEDERILKIDLDACPPALRQYYQTCQEEILERQAARRRMSQAP